MSTAEVAKGLVDLCREGKNMDAIEKYYSDSIVSVESGSAPGLSAETKGLEAIRAKGKWWGENHQVHSATINGPYIGENQFAVEFKYDVTNKPSGQRLQMHEMGLYTVEGGKIVREHFFYKTS